MKHIVIISNIVDEETFVSEVINKAGAALDLQLKFENYEYIINYNQQFEREVSDYLKRNNIRFVFEND